jgi:hypothetical protein
MTSTDTRVNVFSWPDTTRSAQEHRWVADVDRLDGESVHTTEWHATRDDAIDAAELWARENGYRVVPYPA